MFFNQIPAECMSQIVALLATRSYAYDPAHCQLVVWGSPDGDLTKQIEMAVMKYEMNS